MHYYSFNISDFSLSTNHLTLEEEAVYRRLLDYYYSKEKPIPAETQPVIRRLRLGSHSDTVASILNEFFELDDDGWHNSRADIEIAAYHDKAEVARKNGKLGGRPPKNKGLKTQSVILANPAETGSKANQELITNNQELITNKHIPTAPHWMNAYVETFWSSYPKKTDKKKSIDRLKKMIKNKPDEEFFYSILHKVNAKALVTDKQFWPSPDRYLRDELWNDEIIEYSDNEKNRSQQHRKESALERADRLQREMDTGTGAFANHGRVLEVDDTIVSTQVPESFW